MDSVVLESELWDRLVGIAGPTPSWVHGCALTGDHPDRHHAPAGYRGGHLWWLRWEEGGEADLVALGPCPDPACMLFEGHGGMHRGHEPAAAPTPVGPPAARAKPAPPADPDPASSPGSASTVHSAAGNGAAPTAAPRTDSHARRGAADESASLDEIARALWAVAAAVDRLADTRADAPADARFPRGLVDGA